MSIITEEMPIPDDLKDLDEAQKAGVVDGVVRNITYKDLPVARTTTMRTVTKRTKSKVLPGANKKSAIPKRRD